MDDTRLAGFLTAQTGGPVEVRSSRRMTGGFSRAMFDVDTSAGHFVVRVQQGGVFGTSSMAEFGLMQSLHASGSPVANVRWLEPTGEVLGQPFFVMDHIDAAYSGASQTMDAETAASFVRALAALHALDPAAHLPAVDLAQSTHILIEHWRNVGKSSGAPRVPLLDAAEMWLHQNAPASRRLSLVHGDAGPGNVLATDGEVLALTDWEFGHVGDPAEDWACCASIRGSETMSREAWISLFDREAGVKMSNEQWNYWEAFNLYKAACADRSCFGLLESGVNRSPDMVILGSARHHLYLRRLVDMIK